MHPIVSEQIARIRLQELHREAELRRRLAAASERHGPRLVVAALALRVARALDRDGRIVPAHARATR